MPWLPYNDATADAVDRSLRAQFPWWLVTLVASLAVTNILGGLGLVGTKGASAIAAISAVLLGLNIFHARMLHVTRRQAAAGADPRWAWRFARPSWFEVFGVSLFFVAVAVFTPWFDR